MIQKKGMQLAINTTVVMILSIIIMGAGLYFVFNFLSEAGQTSSELDSSTKAQLERLLTQDQTFVVPSNRQTVLRGKSKTIAYGIFNNKKNVESAQFRVEVEFLRAYDDEKNSIEIDGDSWLRYEKSPVVVKRYDRHTDGILFSVPKNVRAGEYVFDVRAFSGSENYGSKRVYIQVP